MGTLAKSAVSGFWGIPSALITLVNNVTLMAMVGIGLITAKQVTTDLLMKEVRNADGSD